MNSLENQVMDAGYGNLSLTCDGEIHRFIPPHSKKPDGWYVVNEAGGVHIVSIGNWKDGTSDCFCDKDTKQFSTPERQQYQEAVKHNQEKIEKDKEARQENAKQHANELWNNASSSELTQHSYLLKKKVLPYGLRLDNDCLLVPLRDSSGDLCSIQRIYSNSNKRFFAGGKVKGCYHLIGKPKNGIVLCEGYATGASIREATGEAVAVCFDAGNLKDAGLAIRSKYPNIEIVIASDNDQFNATNTGKLKGQEVAQLIEAKMVFPVFKDSDLDKKPTDFNDLHTLYGLAAVVSQIEADTSQKDVWDEPIPLPNDDIAGSQTEFLLHWLPDFLQVSASEVKRFFTVPLASPATVGLSCIATAIGKKAVVVEKTGLEHYPSLFFAVVAGSGERKTPVFSAMTKPLELFAKNQQGKYEDECQDAKWHNSIADGLIKKEMGKLTKKNADHDVIKENIKGYEEKKKPIPPSPRLFATDITEERLFQKMDERGGAYAVLTGEGRATFDQILGRYAGGGTGDAIYLAGISGDTITRDRKGGEDGPEERCIYDPALNVCVMIQLDKYLAIARHPNLRSSGLVARMLTTRLPSTKGTRIEYEGDLGLNVNLMDDYKAVITRLLEHSLNEDGEPHKALLSKEATKARREFHNAIERQMGEGCELEDVADIASKIVSQVAKLALLIHLGNEPSLLNNQTSNISLDTWNKAQGLGEFYLDETVKSQRLSGESAKYPPARKALKWIKDKRFEKITKTMLMQSGPRNNGARPDAKEAGAILELLSEYGYLKSITGSGFTVNPVIL